MQAQIAKCIAEAFAKQESRWYGDERKGYTMPRKQPKMLLIDDAAELTAIARAAFFTTPGRTAGRPGSCFRGPAIQDFPRTAHQI
jgi:hypothetical protein